MRRATVITVSDRSAAGLREDASGPVGVDLLREAGWDCPDAVVIPDGADSVERALRAAVASGVELVVTTGGTGVSPRDETPEGTARVIERELPGLAEELRRRGAAEKPAGMLTRGVAGVVGQTLIVNLPGKPAAVSSGIPIVLSVAGHVGDQLAGGDH
ncbi:MogA/MoaB family molybdenum cofactor biosynthesis protein [Microbacterium sp. cx-55]|uniref:MogA/MoaB family molybdenum cofactor biosynthesis protein n=1 Tax=Microbacterium sp. cx-55 TaxID=2875948 RepID=UPI001CBDA9A8|nr:MogA/MoaB family molybdenum cofactor biosynthesis protein [Microbacterium sp. cx-55]MBZ4487951.1 MogA/MoaB family molybdenum cofactor biosynthesis protein [Microbacterium sp. cx-55]UGB34639.1 MogA/MoaB family molybdenum cofactor biosynthesis protein [Microbacterium sp. cx-55]